MLRHLSMLQSKYRTPEHIFKNVFQPFLVYYIMNYLEYPPSCSSAPRPEMTTLAVEVYEVIIPCESLIDPLPREANHKAHPMLSSSTDPKGKISCEILSFLPTNVSVIKSHCTCLYRLCTNRNRAADLNEKNAQPRVRPPSDYQRHCI